MSICNQFSLLPILIDDELYVISYHDTAWRIRMKDDGSKAKQLLHESKLHVKYNRKKTNYENRDYHVQEIGSSSICGYLIYIRKHDACEERRENERRLERKSKQAFYRKQAKCSKVMRNRRSNNCRKNMIQRMADGDIWTRKKTKRQLTEVARAYSDFQTLQYDVFSTGLDYNTCYSL